MKTVILAGGFGTRLAEETAIKPKPMVEIGRHPILWHIMNIYASQNFTDFVIALGYKGELIKQYFLQYYYLESDITVRLGTGEVDVHDGQIDEWTLHLHDTGLNTQTGGRLKRLSSILSDDTFMMTYGDGVADIDVSALVEFHKQHGRLATVTAVRPQSRFGGLDIENDLVTTYREKPQLGEGRINGGFFVLEPEVLDYISSDETFFEREPLEQLAADGQLIAFRHDGFWQSMDTLRDVRLLNRLWNDGNPPWKIWT